MTAFRILLHRLNMQTEKSFQLRPSYIAATLLYVLPLLFLCLFFLDQQGQNDRGMLFWVLFLLSMLPCGIIGGLLSFFRLRKDMRLNNKVNQGIGGFLTLMGLLLSIGGLLGFGLFYVVVG
ncbi:MAG: hypothetical protein JJ975_16385 [Bacteroidia bacterium]|nr:hypothetical protein [Bacteroidia bacterium]